MNCSLSRTKTFAINRTSVLAASPFWFHGSQLASFTASRGSHRNHRFKHETRRIPGMVAVRRDISLANDPNTSATKVRGFFPSELPNHSLQPIRFTALDHLERRTFESRPSIPAFFMMRSKYLDSPLRPAPERFAKLGKTNPLGSSLGGFCAIHSAKSW